MKTLNVVRVSLCCLMLALWTVPTLAQEGAMADAQDKAEGMMAKGEEMQDKAEGMMAKGEEMMAEGEGMMAKGEEMMAEGEGDAMAAMMEAWQKAMTPGAPHEELAKAVGTWSMTMKMWTDPTAEPEVHEGTAERTMILGGRILEERVSSSMMGMDFQGIGQTGYNNANGEYWSTWIDNMSTGNTRLTGHPAEDGTMVFKGEAVDPMTGDQKKMKIVMSQDGPDKETAQFYEAGPDGKMVHTMEIVYQRQN